MSAGQDALTLRVVLSASRAEVGRGIEEARAFFTRSGAGEEATEEVCLALDEVLANVVLHGYRQDPEGCLVLTLQVSDAGLGAEVRDRAPAFDPLQAPAPDLDRPPEERPIGGLGVHLVRTLMDDVSYRREGDENVLRLRRAAR